MIQHEDDVAAGRKILCHAGVVGRVGEDAVGEDDGAEEFFGLAEVGSA